MLTRCNTPRISNRLSNSLGYAGGIADRRQIVKWLVISALAGGCERPGADDGEIVIGSSPTGVPFSFVDPWTNQLTGAIVDVATAAAQMAGFRPDLKITPFSALIPSLLADKIDVIAAAMLRNPEREKIVAFTDPVFAYAGGLAVRADNGNSYPDLQSLREVRVGAQVGTRFLDQLKEAGVRQTPTYENLGDLMRDLKHGRIEAVYGDAPIMAYQLREGPKLPVRLAEEFTPPVAEDVCLVLRKESPLLPKLNEAIGALHKRAIPDIKQKWGLK